MSLEERFFNLLFKYTQNKTLIASLWEAINVQYSEKHRAYHNLQHLKELFTYFDTYKNSLNNANNIAFSIFFHDIIYNIWRNDNEEKSALFAVDKLSGIINATDLQEVNQQIIATKNHIATSNDCKFLVDFDLAILGQAPEKYTDYTKLIRKEYRKIPTFVYKKGRKKVLTHFLNKPFIFATEIFRSEYETQAKENLYTELISL